MAQSKGELIAEGLLTSEVQTSSGSTVFSYFRGPSSADDARPILILLHGYPQTSYMWRKILNLLPSDYPIFIPDLPGYGRSTPSKTDHSKRTIGQAILEALHLRLSSNHKTGCQIYVCGHDRGARVAHRISVDHAHITNPELESAYVETLKNFKLAGTIILDIATDVTQYNSFADPVKSVGAFHWPFLANVALATPIIAAYGGGKWAQDMILRWSGKPDGLASIAENGAMDVYRASFDDVEVIRASCEDYAAGAGIDYERQKKDQEEGRKLAGKVLNVYSSGFLGARYDVPAMWREFASDDCELTQVGIGEGVGHFIAEEAPDQLVNAFKGFIGF